ncbi:PREDICTED: low-density lipoprotein receptor 2-like, partial [Priapulus caudatus]|uniref:Low-density lipoprotein receptor 2-like n=1 Tax=Priapulus caudatus TaxID=37621 RepID=A0ABM1F436_PRICU
RRRPHLVDYRGEPLLLFCCHDADICFDRRFVCDGKNNCVDGSDELPDTCQQFQCLPDEHACNHTNRCLSIGFYCNGFDDCGNAYDEDVEICKHLQCPEGHVKCKETYKCLDRDFFCDGYDDCGNDWDEQYDTCVALPCRDFEAHCPTTGSCYRLSHLCDGSNVDAPLGALEFTCGSNHGLQPLYDYECANIFWQQNCTEPFFRCWSTNMCVDNYELCNGVATCKDRSDESDDACQVKICSSDEFKCRRSGKCIQMRSVCNRKSDFEDGSDEEEEFCLTLPFVTTEKAITDISTEELDVWTSPLPLLEQRKCSYSLVGTSFTLTPHVLHMILLHNFPFRLRTLRHIRINALTLNSLLNPIIYFYKYKDFRLAGISLTCRPIMLIESKIMHRNQHLSPLNNLKTYNPQTPTLHEHRSMRIPMMEEEEKGEKELMFREQVEEEGKG